MNVTQALQARRSVRAFLDRPVDTATLREVLALAARAPSGGNLQPWKLYLLTGNALEQLRSRMRKRLTSQPQPDESEYPIYPESVPEPYRTQRKRLTEAMYGAVGIPREDKAARLRFVAGNFECWGAPVALFCWVDRCMGAAQWSDLGMYLQSLMLLLEERGLASCPQEAWSLYHDEVRGQCKAPRELMLFCGMSIGYADTGAAVNGFRSDRLPLDQFAEFLGFP